MDNIYSAYHYACKTKADREAAELAAANAEEAKNLANEAVTRLGEFDSTVDTAKADIVALSSTEQAAIVALSDTSKSEIVSVAEENKSSAVSEINSTKDTAIGEVEQAGSLIATYQYPIIPIAETSGSVSLATNTIYQMEITDAVVFVLPEVNTAVFNQIKVMAKITGTPTIDWGTTKFFDKKTPLIEEGCYDVYFDYDNLLSAWVCGAMDKG
jgi:hypothetical protein